MNRKSYTKADPRRGFSVFQTELFGNQYIVVTIDGEFTSITPRSSYSDSEWDYFEKHFVPADTFEVEFQRFIVGSTS